MWHQARVFFSRCRYLWIGTAIVVALFALDIWVKQSRVTLSQPGASAPSEAFSKTKELAEASRANESEETKAEELVQLQLQFAQSKDGTRALDKVYEKMLEKRAERAEAAAKAESECRDKLRARGIIIQSTPCVDIDSVIDNLKTGTYAFNKPTYAYVDHSIRIVLVLRTEQNQEIDNSFQQTEGTVEKREARFAQFVEATLHGTDFKIDPVGPQQRTATSHAPVEWEWNVTPLSAGTKLLVIDVDANLIIDGQKSLVKIAVLREPIEIRITTLQWIKATVGEARGILEALGVVAAAFIGLFAWAAPVRRKVFRFIRRRRHSRSASDGHHIQQNSKK
jgi:hypothetical protein